MVTPFVHSFHVTGLFLYPSKHEKTSGFLILSGGVKRKRPVSWNGLTRTNIFLEFFQNILIVAIFQNAFEYSGNIQKQSPEGVLWNFSKFTGLRHAILLKNRLWHRCFSVNFETFLRTPFFIEYLRWLIQNRVKYLRLSFFRKLFLKKIPMDLLVIKVCI